MMNDAPQIRPAQPEDAVATAAIKDAWIEESDWLPRLQNHDEILQNHRDRMIPQNMVFVIGQPVLGYLALSDDGYVTSLFCAKKGQGLGKALMDHAKGIRARLLLWSFEDNQKACRFYEREGFVKQRREENESDEGLADLLYQWEAA